MRTSLTWIIEVNSKCHEKFSHKTEVKETFCRLTQRNQDEDGDTEKG